MWPWKSTEVLMPFLLILRTILLRIAEICHYWKQWCIVILSNLVSIKSGFDAFQWYALTLQPYLGVGKGGKRPIFDSDTQIPDEITFFQTTTSVLKIPKWCLVTSHQCWRYLFLKYDLPSSYSGPLSVPSLHPAENASTASRKCLLKLWGSRQSYLHKSCTNFLAHRKETFALESKKPSFSLPIVRKSSPKNRKNLRFFIQNCLIVMPYFHQVKRKQPVVRWD